MYEGDAYLPRHAFSARDAARAGELWRAFQELAVDASSAAGWTPQRYRETNTAFIVRAMLVVHLREPFYGERLRGRSWVHRFRRETLSTRDIVIESVEHGPVAFTRQEWVHVSARLDASKGTGALVIEPTRGSPELVQAFPEEPWPLPGEPVLPTVHTRLESETHVFVVEPWWTWMDPLDHVNHPVYVDWIDEAIARVFARAGGIPRELASVAEQVTFRAAIGPREPVHVETKLVGTALDGAAIIEARFLVRGALVANATVVRRLVSASPVRIEDAYHRAPEGER